MASVTFKASTSMSSSDESIKQEEDLRVDLFKSIVEQDGLTIIPGHYGGEHCYESLAIARTANNTVTLMLGLKVTDEEGNILLSSNSLGAHMQYSPEWIQILIFSLSLSDELKGFSEMIAEAHKTDTLVRGVLYVDKVDAKVKAIRV